METMRVKLTFMDDILGTAPSDPEIHRSYIASKAPDAMSTEEEVAALGVDEVTEKGMTVFHKDAEGTPVLWNYQIKGFFKSACSAMRAIEGTKSSKLKAYKKQIDLRIFVFADAENKAERKIRINVNGEVGSCQRPLRAQTMQGERRTRSRSRQAPVWNLTSCSWNRRTGKWSKSGSTTDHSTASASGGTAVRAHSHGSMLRRNGGIDEHSPAEE